MDGFIDILKGIQSVVWGPITLILLVGTGLYFTIRLGFLQITKLPRAIRYIFEKEKGVEGDDGDVSAFASLCTTLAATIGTGSIVGVATALRTGGPGALFWMWVSAFVGMTTKYAEGVLAVKYRTVDENGEIAGGPMYYIQNGMGKKWIWLAKIFAIFGVMTALMGCGTFPQVNAITESAHSAFGLPIWLVGIIVTIAVAAVVLGGIKSISKAAELIVPVMAIFYVLGSIAIMIINADAIPGVFKSIFDAAFHPRAMIGGASGTIIISVMTALQTGVARGVYTNEAGLGSAPIAAAAAQTKEPVRQGLVSMTGTFIDTIVICTLTGLSVVITGAWQVEGLEGVQVTTYAFQNGLPFSNQFCAAILMICLVFFAFTTILGWDYYGERCLEYLTGKDEKKIKIYRWLYILAVFIGPYMTVAAVWTIADIFNGLMALPNMIALFALSGVVVKETKRFFEVYADQKMAKKKSSASIKDAAEN